MKEKEIERLKELKKIYYWHFQAFHGGENNE